MFAHRRHISSLQDFATHYEKSEERVALLASVYGLPSGYLYFVGSLIEWCHMLAGVRWFSTYLRKLLTTHTVVTVSTNNLSWTVLMMFSLIFVSNAALQS